MPLSILPGLPEYVITRELQLLLLALLAGALGSYVHASKSLVDYIGNRTATASWFWWYITRPFLGMAMALVFYSLLRGGFLAGTPADAKVVNPFGVIAIAALVGMFADKAAAKLGEIFETLFKADDHRSDKLNAPAIHSLQPDTVKVNAGTVTVKIVGDRLGKIASVRFNATAVWPDSVSDKEVKATFRGPELTHIGAITVTGVNPDGTTSTSAILHVTDLVLAAPVVQPQVREDYDQPVVATSGTAPLQWSVKNQPAWLSIDQNGHLKGKPPTSGPIRVTVEAKDADGATVSIEVPLTVAP